MTPSDLDEIRKRCEAYGSDSVPDAFRDRQVLLDEVERLQRENAEGHRIMQSLVMEKQTIHRVMAEEMARLRARLALLEPVWEAAKRWRQCDESTSPGPCNHDDLADAIDAAMAKEGK